MINTRINRIIAATKMGTTFVMVAVLITAPPGAGVADDGNRNTPPCQDGIERSREEPCTEE